MILMSALKKKKEDEYIAKSFLNSPKDRDSVIAKIRSFQEGKSDPSQSKEAITRLLYLISSGEKILPSEAETLFFSITKLYGVNHHALRKMVHIALYEICDTVEGSFIVVESLKKDSTSNQDFIKSSAIKVLCKILDSPRLTSIERVMKQLIVSQNSSVSSCALVSTLRFLPQSMDVIQRWINEIKEAMNSYCPTVQYHALMLLYSLKKRDHLSLTKDLVDYDSNFRHKRCTIAQCASIRISVNTILRSGNSDAVSKQNGLLESKFQMKDEAVVLELCRSVACHPEKFPHLMKKAVHSLVLFLGHSNTVVRYFAIKIVSQMSSTCPQELQICVPVLQRLMKDSHKELSVMAVASLLKIGSETCIDTVLEELNYLISEVSSSFVVFVVKHLSELSIVYPKRCSQILNLLFAIYEKHSDTSEVNVLITQEIIKVLTKFPQFAELGMNRLCEIIDDCMMTDITINILTFIGQQGVKMKNPTFYIKYVYNRILLDSDIVRTAAVSTLARFGVSCPDLRPSVILLLSRLRRDQNYDVRERATLYYHTLKSYNEDTPAESDLISPSTITNVDQTLQRLSNYLSSSDFSRPFSFDGISRYPLETIFTPEPLKISTNTSTNSERKEFIQNTEGSMRETEFSSPKTEPTDDVSFLEAARSAILKVEDFQSFGEMIHSSVPIDLTEPSFEYYISCIKYIYANHVVFQLVVVNNQSDKILKNIRCKAKMFGDFQLVTTMPCSKIGNHSDIGYLYVAIRFPSDPFSVSGEFSCIIRFIAVDCDPTTGDSLEIEEKEEYQLDDIHLVVADLFAPLQLENFQQRWTELGDEMEHEEKFALASEIKDIGAAVKFMVEKFGGVLSNGSVLPKAQTTTYSIFLASRYKNGEDVLIHIMFALTESRMVLTKVKLRCADPVIPEILFSVL